MNTIRQSAVLRDKVSYDVNERYRMIYKLVEYSKYEYEFLDVALERALTTLELGLKERYLDLEHKITRKKLNELIQWANDNSLLIEKREKIHIWRKLRNSLVGHPQGNTILGLVNYDLIIQITNVINSLYNPPKVNRMILKNNEQAKELLKKELEKGFKVNVGNEEYLIIYGELIGYSYSKNVFYYGLIPIFSINDDDTKDQEIPNPIFIEASNPIGIPESETIILNPIKAKIQQIKQPQKDILKKAKQKLEKRSKINSLLSYKIFQLKKHYGLMNLNGDL